MLNLHHNEEKMLKYWKEHQINEKVRAKNKGKGKPVYFLDGPPYVTGDLHPGHIWVKGLKDLFVRYKRYRGFDVVDRAGYDVQGLPTENAVEKKLKITSKKDIEEKLGIENFIKACREWIEYYMERMTNDYEKFGVSLDFSNPYLPYKDSYMEIEWSMIKTAAEKGYLYQGNKTTAYCPHCESVVSQGTMEVEHSDEKDPSIYILFKVVKGKLTPKIKVDDNTYLLVWTTTPWTLPANVAIAVNPTELYVNAEIGGRNLIMAKQRLDAVVALLNENAIVEEEFYGSELVGLYYTNALEEKVPKQKELRKHHKVVAAPQLVSVEEGTGLVHTAPGHGLEDYVLGVSLKVPIFSPVAPNATYNDDAGAYKGLKVPEEANKTILADLQELGVLMHSGTITHSYPHCWRCHTKIIFMASPQWFLNVQKIKKKLLKANQKIAWHPEEAKAWENDILANSPDWCISRQRYWATPLPVWICEKCKEVNVIGSKRELEERAVDPEAVRDLEDLHRPYIDRIKVKCAKCNGEAKRVLDVMDVWWDSGTAFRASLTEEQFQELFPVEFVVEYVEQIRSWFQYVLKVGVFVYGKNPWKHIVVHGIMWGNDGRKMSKSFANFKPLHEMTAYATADAFRLWALGYDPILNRNLNETEIKDRDKIVLMLYNIANMLKEYQDAIGYQPKLKSRLSSNIESEEAWISSRFESTKQKVTNALDSYDPYTATKSITDFIIEDFSRFYLKLAKKKILYGSKKQAKSAIDVINHILYSTLILISPVTPFVSESIYLDNYRFKESIFLEDWPKFNKKVLNKVLEDEFAIAQEAITAILNSREKADVRLRWPLSSATVATRDQNAITALQKLSQLVENYTNVKKLIIKEGAGTTKEIRPLFGKLGPLFKADAPLVAQELQRANADEVEAEISKGNEYGLRAQDGKLFNIPKEAFTIIERHPDPSVVHFKYGIASVDKTRDMALMEEAVMRELTRAIQDIRKKKGLKQADWVDAEIDSGKAFNAVLEKNSSDIKKTIRAKSLRIKELKDVGETFEVEGTVFRILLNKREKATS